MSATDEYIQMKYLYIHTETVWTPLVNTSLQEFLKQLYTETQPVLKKQL